jgi:hypothetical protein
MASTRRPVSPASLVQRKRAGTVQVRKTVYFVPTTIDRLERYAFDQRLTLSELIDAAALEYLDKHAPVQSRRRTSAPPSARSAPPSAPPSTTRTSAPPKSKRS